jgi:hypothetical protein
MAQALTLRHKQTRGCPRKVSGIGLGWSLECVRDSWITKGITDTTLAFPESQTEEFEFPSADGGKPAGAPADEVSLG